MGKIIAVANQKGGVGKTTTSVNIAACLARRKFKTLLVDIDPQGNGTNGLGVEKHTMPLSVYDCLINNVAAKEAVLPTKWSNLFVLGSNINLSGAEIELVPMDKREFKLKECLKVIKNDYDFIIIDCPPSLGLVTLNAFCAADSVLMPIQCEYYALEGLGQLTNTIKTIKKSLNPQLEIEGVLPTMFDTRTNLSIQVVDEVKKYFSDKVYKTPIPRNIRLSEAPSFGEPIIEYDITSRGAEAYLSVTDEIIANNK